MARRNLRERGDIDPSTLRQRRDFYAISIGLALFQLAHGSLGQANTLSNGVLPLKFANPCWFLWAAWAGFFYFLLRYRLMAPPAWRAYYEDAMWQAGDLPSTRKVVADLIIASNRNIQTEVESHRNLIMTRDGPVPKVNHTWFKPNLSLHSIRRSYGDTNRTTMYMRDGSLDAKQNLMLCWSIARGYLLAITHERSFTDYVLPYLFGCATLLIAICQWLSGQTSLCLPWR